MFQLAFFYLYKMDLYVFLAYPVVVFFLCFLILKNKKHGLRILIAAIFTFLVVNWVYLLEMKKHPYYTFFMLEVKFAFSVWFTQLVVFFAFSILWWWFAPDKEKQKDVATDKGEN